MIKQGAKLVESAQDVLEEMAWAITTPPLLPVTSAPDPIWDAMDAAPMTADSIAERCGLTLDALSAKLLMLELEGRVATMPGGRYQKLN